MRQQGRRQGLCSGLLGFGGDSVAAVDQRRPRHRQSGVEAVQVASCVFPPSLRSAGFTHCRRSATSKLPSPAIPPAPAETRRQQIMRRIIDLICLLELRWGRACEHTGLEQWSERGSRPGCFDLTSNFLERRVVGHHPHLSLSGMALSTSSWPRSKSGTGAPPPPDGRRRPPPAVSVASAYTAAPTTPHILAHLTTVGVHDSELRDRFHVGVGVQRPRR
ncbi:hypothetical protein [Oryza sativa Japonica Group]|uniref:Uncharacterized protein n=1 Tax=Oryza sativa subsp. japonica TaxID=39947 RepID=Q5JKI9_ORYSJ|nr:hypothetical protein [Oryza sativa Japonica Group]